MSTALECIFDGGARRRSGKKPMKPMKPMKSTKATKSTKRSESYCYQCSGMTLDKMPAFSDNIRKSSCSKCGKERSVFTQ